MRHNYSGKPGYIYAHWDIRRCRFIAHTADLSAFAGYSAIPMNLLNLIIGLCRMF